MKKIRIVLFALLCLFATVAISELQPSEFRDKFIESLDVEANQLEVEIVDELALGLKGPTGNEFTSYLDNAYALYLQDPDSIDSIIEQYSVSLLESVNIDMEEPLSADRIVPIVKDSNWADEMEALMKQRGAEELTQYYEEPLADGLRVHFAEDSPTSVSYLSSEMLNEAGIELSSVRELALNNLERLLPALEVHGEAGLFMVIADGNFEASLLLFDEMWSKDNFDVKGDIVITIPARDILLVSGSDDKEQLETLAEVTLEMYEESSYYLTTQMYVRKDGKWAIFKQ